MAHDVNVTLNNPLITTLGAFGIFLIGLVIGAHWRPPVSTVFRMAATGALVVVLHDLLYALVWAAITRECIRRSRRGGQ